MCALAVLHWHDWHAVAYKAAMPTRYPGCNDRVRCVFARPSLGSWATANEGLGDAVVQEALRRGMESLSQAEVGSALQVYFNLGQLRQVRTARLSALLQCTSTSCQGKSFRHVLHRSQCILCSIVWSSTIVTHDRD